MMKESVDSAVLAEGIQKGNRRALARAITLIESTRSSDRLQAEALLTLLLPRTGKAMRIGISGSPGAGKSTLIETLGSRAIEQGGQLAVLAVDPSSRRSGGSILGDKTRMEGLVRSPAAFIRPSPAGDTLGGVARRTREAMLLAEAAAFDVVLVETVGVGQSEIAVAEMTDLYVLLVSPGGGDELQGIKRGVMELADLVLVTKADGELTAAASRAAADYRHALHLMRPKYSIFRPRVLEVSALEGRGIAETWALLREFHRGLAISGTLDSLRNGQLRRWFWNEVQAIVVEGISANAGLRGQAQEIERAVLDHKVLPSAAARALMQRFHGP